MPAPMSPTLPLAAPATPAAPANAVAPKETAAAGKAEFERMVRRPDARDGASALASPQTARPTRKTAMHAEPAREAMNPPIRHIAKPAQERDATDISSVLPLPLPADVSLPVAPSATQEPPAAVLVDPLGNPLLGAASTATFLPDTVLGGTATLPEPAPALPTDIAAATPTVFADSAGEATPLAANSSAAQPAAATHESASKAPLQNLLSFATHLAAGQVAAAVPDAVALGRDVVEALRSDDTDGATPAGNALAGIGASSASLGLSRTETVNAMEAPAADLHGGHFDEDIGDAVRWMADQKIGHAHIKVTPHEVGTVEVRLRLDGDRVHADFSSAQPEVRQALEGSLPRLRDMLGQHGFQLAHADVGHQHSPPHDTPARQANGEAASSMSAADAELPRPVRMTALGLLDAYA